MSRLLFLIAVAIIIFLLVKSFRKSLQRQQDTVSQVEDMVRCAQCGVHFPRSEGIHAEGEYYCSAEHRAIHRK